MRLADFDYILPEHLIAQTPLDNRADSRLMVVDPAEHTVTHTHFSHISRFLRAGDVLVLNNSKVLPARVYATKTDTQARIELLLLRPAAASSVWSALAKPAKRLHIGTKLAFASAANPQVPLAHAEVVDILPDGLRVLQFDVADVDTLLQQVGTMPLPPYIHAPLADQNRYQTVYAKLPGSVAAPTAGLHFTEALLDELCANGVETHFVTLHVGIGTFRTVQVDDIEAHPMHSEWYEISEETAAAVRLAKQEGRRVIAVGTTALRTLESASAGGACAAGSAETDIFIYPGYQFRTADALITNFHLPKSTLFMLVAAWLGLAEAKRIYEIAIAEEYRFFSFGDAMLLTGRGDGA